MLIHVVVIHVMKMQHVQLLKDSTPVLAMMGGQAMDLFVVQLVSINMHPFGLPNSVL